MAQSTLVSRPMATLTLLASTISSAFGASALPPSDPWSASYAKALALVSNMTLAEMNNITIGYAVSAGTVAAGSSCSGVSGSVPRLGYPGMCFQDAGNGVRAQDGVSSYASGVSVGASWNAELAYERGLYMGAEFQKKGVNVALGPVVGPLGRLAEGGRNWEGFGADPYLDGMLVMPTIKGMQESVIACTKHFVAYEQETNRTVSPLNPNAQAVSNNLDDKTMQDAVQAGTGSIMCSYNRINGTYACANDKTLNGLLKGELGFSGFVVSDWDAQHSGLSTATGGLDVVMPSSTLWDDNQLARAVQNGTLSRARLMDMAVRTIATWYQVGQNSPLLPPIGYGEVSNLSAPHRFVNARDPASAPSLMQQAQEGHVLVKNVNGALPIKKPQVLSLFGNDALPGLVFTDTYAVLEGNTTFDEFQFNWQFLGNNLTNAYVQQTYKPHAVNGTLVTGGGSGANTPPYISAPWDAINAKAMEDGTQLFWNFQDHEVYVEAASDACLIFLNEYSSEGWDRAGLTDTGSDDLVLNVASQCGNTMVFIHNAGIRFVDAFIDHPNVTAVMFAHLPGQDSGRALISLIYGDASPSGRLPYTVAKSDSDYGSLLSPCVGTINETLPNCNFTEGVNIDYRSFLYRNVTPRYEFGYGLTYTNFTYAELSIETSLNSSCGLFDTVGTVSIRVANIGSVTSAEVSQLYLQIPGADTRVLRGFAKTPLAPGNSKPVTFNLRKKDISQWDTASQQWVQPKGTYQVMVGASVLDIKLQGTFTM